MAEASQPALCCRSTYCFEAKYSTGHPIRNRPIRKPGWFFPKIKKGPRLGLRCKARNKCPLPPWSESPPPLGHPAACPVGVACYTLQFSGEHLFSSLYSWTSFFTAFFLRFHFSRLVPPQKNIFLDVQVRKNGKIWNFEKYIQRHPPSRGREERRWDEPI